jgi:DeoR family fructose operon transcriptional repressor
MKPNLRRDLIYSLIERKGFLNLEELSQECGVSYMTIRRDLDMLESNNRIRRVIGGAVSLNSRINNDEANNSDRQVFKADIKLIDHVDVLIASSVDPYYDNQIVDLATKNNIPIIAESIAMPGQSTLVTIDNYQAGFDLGYQVGQLLCSEGISKAHLLDLSFHQPNTQNRSHGFVDGLSKTCPSFEMVLSIDAQSQYEISYQLARDALQVYPRINLIFGINEVTALGAIKACRDLNIAPNQIMVVPCGLEGDTIKDELVAGSYCKMAMASSPELASLICIQAAIAVYNQSPLPEKLILPHVVLTAETMSKYYTRAPSGRKNKWMTVKRDFKHDSPIKPEKTFSKLPNKIGLIVPFIEHEWYQQLITLIKTDAKQYNIRLQVIDAKQTIHQELEYRRQQIAETAAKMIETGDVVIIDSGPISAFLAKSLEGRTGITVITNSMTAIDILKTSTGIVLISTGGVISDNAQVMIGPTTINTIKGLFAAKLCLMVSGVTLDFGLSHNEISEATVKTAMIQSASQILLLADNTSFIANSGIWIAPLSVISKVITDSGLSPDIRLNISKTGIQVIVV